MASSSSSVPSAENTPVPKEEEEECPLCTTPVAKYNKPFVCPTCRYKCCYVCFVNNCARLCPVCELQQDLPQARMCLPERHMQMCYDCFENWRHDCSAFVSDEEP